MDTDKITENVDSEIAPPPEAGGKPEATPREEVPPVDLQKLQEQAARLEKLEKQLTTKVKQTESERRRAQSEADRARQRAEQAERVTQQAMAALDPEQRVQMEAAMYRESAKTPPTPQQPDARDFFGPLFEDAGVDPDDVDIDYGYIAAPSDSREGLRRLNRTIAQIQQREQAEKPKPEAKVPAPEVKTKPESVPTEALRPSGGGAPGRWTTSKLRSLTPLQRIEKADEIMKAMEAGEIEEE